LKGRRRSAATSYLGPIRGRSNLFVFRRAHVRRIVIENGRAVGVEYDRNGRTHTARSDKEIVLAAGAIGSPHLLMLSGVGQPAMLERHGVPLVAALPGVGENLQDHQTVYLRLTCNQPITLHSMLRIDRAALMMLTGILLCRGLATAFPTQGGSFVKCHRGLAAPDLQISLTIAFGGSRILLPFQRHWRHDPREQDGFMLMAWLLRPESRGRITLRSADPHDNPVLDPNCLSAPADRAVLREGLAIMRRLAAEPALARYVGEEQSPGSHVRSEADIDAWIARDMNTSHHQVGTCKMGHDAMAVVDDQLRVRGVAGFRVADASIMPTLIGGNTHATAVMIGEKAADMMLARAPLAVEV
jgi:choline dehydrogenase